MKKKLQFFAILALSIFTNSSFAGGLNCIYRIGKEPFAQFNKNFCEKVKNECLSPEFSKKFEGVNFIVATTLDSKTQGIEFIYMNDEKSTGAFDQASKDSYLSGITAESLKANLVNGVSANDQLLYQTTVLMCKVAKKFTAVSMKVVP